MKFFALKSMTNNKGCVIGQQPKKVIVPEIIIELIRSDNWGCQFWGQYLSGWG